MKTSAPASAVALVAASLLVAGCGGGASSEPTTAAAETEVSSEPSTRVIEIAIEGGKPVGGITRVSAKKAQPIRLIVHSDVADEVHVHGYDLHEDVQAGGSTQIEFRATIAGVFEAELENRKLQILELTVK